MAFPIQDIGDGIRRGDWGMVVDGYAALTGERLDVPVRADGVEQGRAAALAFYANPMSWVPGGSPFAPTPCAAALDCGRRAREATDKPGQTGLSSSMGDTLALLESVAAPTVPDPPPPQPAPTASLQPLAVKPQPRGEASSEFHVERSSPMVGTDGKRYARKEPLPKNREPMFVDDGKLAADQIESDRALAAKLGPRVGRRPPPQKAVRACADCGTQHQVDPRDYPPSREYVCEPCIAKDCGEEDDN